MIMFKRFMDSSLYRNIEITIGDIARIKRSFGHYHLHQDQIDSMRLAIYYHPLEKLTGEMHIDAKLLMGIQTITQILKTHGFIKNEATPIVAPGSPYDQTVLKKIEPKSGLEPKTSHAISKITLHEKYIEILITGKNLDPLMHNLVACLDTLSLTATQSLTKSRASRL